MIPTLHFIFYYNFCNVWYKKLALNHQTFITTFNVSRFLVLTCFVFFFPACVDATL